MLLTPLGEGGWCPEPGDQRQDVGEHLSHTATSAFGNVMQRPWLMTFAPILISFSRRLVSDPARYPRIFWGQPQPGFYVRPIDKVTKSQSGNTALNSGGCEGSRREPTMFAN
jgi:hypothetical protein